MQKYFLGKNLNIGEKQGCLMHFFIPFNNVGPNLKSYLNRFLSEFDQNCKQTMSSFTNDKVLDSWNGYKICNAGQTHRTMLVLYQDIMIYQGKKFINSFLSYVVSWPVPLSFSSDIYL